MLILVTVTWAADEVWLLTELDELKESVPDMDWAVDVEVEDTVNSEVTVVSTVLAGTVI